jgi:hypothetical protein
MIYTTYSQAWLEDPSSVKGILVEVGYRDVVGATESTFYLSNIGYITGDASVRYLPYIVGGVKFTETLPIDGQPTMSFGDIEISNPNGELDTWLDTTKHIMTNRSVKVYIGDPFWVTTNLADVQSKFLKIFDGVSAGVDSRSRGTINIKVRDKLEVLNTPVTDVVMGATGTWATGQSNSGALVPLVFGEVFNITPTLRDPANLEYIVNNGQTEDIIEVRDNGVPITVTKFLSTGIFRLVNPLVGSVTASVQGVKNSINFSTGAQLNTYNNTITNLIVLLVTQYGTNKLVAAELDSTNLTDFNAANPVSAGIYLGESANVLSVCQQLANSIGAQLFMTRQGTLQILRIGTPTTDASVTITDSDILHHSLSISSITEVQAATSLAYCKNWTIQSGLVTAIYPEDKVNFDTADYLETALDPTTQTNFKLSGITPTTKETLLIEDTHATAETNRLNTFYKSPRTTYRFTGTAKLLSLKLGQPVLLKHSRYGLSAGVSGQAVSLSPDWLRSTIEVEVLI